MIVKGEDLEFALRLRKYVVDGIASKGFVMARKCPEDCEGVYLSQEPHGIQIGTFSYGLKDGCIVRVVNGTPVFFSPAEKYPLRHTRRYEELLTHIVDNVRISLDVQTE